MSIKPWSFSRIKAFEQCPKKFYHLKIAKDYTEPQTEAMSYGTAFHLAAEEYVRDGKPIPTQFEFAKDALDALMAKRLLPEAGEPQLLARRAPKPLSFDPSVPIMTVYPIPVT